MGIGIPGGVRTAVRAALKTARTLCALFGLEFIEDSRVLDAICVTKLPTHASGKRRAAAAPIVPTGAA